MQAYIQTIISRIDSLNQQRIERALAIMDQKGKQVFNLIPTLLHYNHPAVPGYYDKPVPYGVHSLEENDIQTQFIAQISATQSEPIEPDSEAHILGLYTMGSTSSIGQSTSSDLDIWVCVSPEMGDDERSHLVINAY